MSNKLHADFAVPPIIESIKLINCNFVSGDLEAATKTITATAEAAGLGNADYHNHETMPIPTDSRLAILNFAAFLALTIDSDDGTHDLRCRVYVDAQDASHMLFDISCTTTGAQAAVTNLNATTLATIFNLLKDGAAHTYYFFLWSPGNHSPVISLISIITSIGTASTTTFGLAYLSFLSPVHCELQVRCMSSVNVGTAGFFAFMNDQGWYEAAFAVTDTGAITFAATAGASAGGSWTWQLLPAGCVFKLYAKGNTAVAYQGTADTVLYIKRWN